jgi:hypothetical protein
VKLQYSESDIPAYFSFARQFTLCDNYFTKVASQSAVLVSIDDVVRLSRPASGASSRTTIFSKVYLYAPLEFFFSWELRATTYVPSRISRWNMVADRRFTDWQRPHDWRKFQMHVLVVEDEERLAQNLAKAISKNPGYAVDVALDCNEGLHLAESGLSI